MNRPLRVCLPLMVSLIAIALVSPLLADEVAREKAAADLAQATEVRGIALRNYQANCTALKGVQCKMTSTITMNVGLLARQNTDATDIVDDRVVHVPAVNGVRPSRAGGGVLADNESHDDGDEEEEDEADSSDRIVRLRAIGSSKRVVDIAAGTSTRTSEHRVFFFGLKVRNERYDGDTIDGTHIRNGVEYRYESATCGVFGTPLVSRGTIDDPSIRSGPIIDPRDFGASSGVGRLEEMLATWEVVSAISCIAKCGRSGLIAIKLREPVAAREHRDFVNECVLYLDPKTRLLPVVVEHFQQGTLLQVVEITYAKCDWLPEACYLATEAIYAMPADPEQSRYSSVAEINAHSRQRFVVSEAAAFEPTDNDKMFRVRSTKTMWTNGFESTLIAAPLESPATVDRIVDASKTLPVFLGGLLVIAVGGVGIVLRQQVLAR